MLQLRHEPSRHKGVFSASFLSKYDQKEAFKSSLRRLKDALKVVKEA